MTVDAPARHSDRTTPDCDSTGLRRRRRRLPGWDHGDGIVRTVPCGNRDGAERRAAHVELIDFETTTAAAAYEVIRMDLHVNQVVVVTGGDAGRAAEGFAAAVALIGRNRLRNLLNTLSYRWDYYLKMTTMMLMTLFDSAAVDGWSLMIQRRSWRHANVERAAPIAMPNCIWFCMLSKRSCLVLQREKKIEKFD